MHRSRYLVRLLIGAALCAALATSALVPVPEILPTAAFDQSGIYRLQIALMVFYGTLLLVTPAYSGLARGRLPTEISTRGARFAEKAEQSAVGAEASIARVERAVDSIAERLDTAQLEINRLKGIHGGDSRQPPLDSSP